MIKPKIFLIIVLILVILVIAGTIISIILIIKKAPPKEPTIAPSEETTIAEEIYGFNAEIKEIKDKTLILEGFITRANIEKEPLKVIVKAVVTDETRITKLKFPEVPKGSKEPVYPEEIEISFGELKVGDRIHIITTRNISENIKNQTEFNINNISLVE